MFVDHEISEELMLNAAEPDVESLSSYRPGLM